MSEITSYEIPETTWQDLEAQIQALGARIESGEELNDSDFQALKSAVAHIESYGKEYTRAVNQQSKQYKNWLQWRLKEIGYDQVKNYMALQKQKNDQLINQRVNQKLAIFRDIIHEELHLNPFVNSTGLRETMINLFIGRFPKVNSGAVSNEIKKWDPIKSVIHMNMSQVESILTENQAMLYLPLHSNTFRTFSEYLRTGDSAKLENIQEVFKSDADLLRRVVMKQQMKSISDLLGMIDGVTHSDVDDQTKLEQIKQLILVFETL